MRNLHFALFFSSFLYLKVTLDGFHPRYTSPQDISILASFLMSCVFIAIVFYEKVLYKTGVVTKEGEPIELNLSKTRECSISLLEAAFTDTFIRFLGVTLIHVLLCRTIIFGFSKKFNNAIYRSDEQFTYFCFIVIAPILLHYVVYIILKSKKTNFLEQKIACEDSPVSDQLKVPLVNNLRQKPIRSLKQPDIYIYRHARTLLDMIKFASETGGSSWQYKIVRDFIGADDAIPFTEAQYETFAWALEKYVREGKMPNQVLRGLFEKIDHKKSADEIDIVLSNCIRKVFDELHQ